MPRHQHAMSRRIPVHYPLRYRASTRCPGQWWGVKGMGSQSGAPDAVVSVYGWGQASCLLQSSRKVWWHAVDPPQLGTPSTPPASKPGAEPGVPHPVQGSSLGSLGTQLLPWAPSCPWLPRQVWGLGPQASELGQGCLLTPSSGSWGVSRVEGGLGGPWGLQESVWPQAGAGGCALAGTTGALGGGGGPGLRNELEGWGGRKGHTEPPLRAPSQSPVCA